MAWNSSPFLYNHVNHSQLPLSLKAISELGKIRMKHHVVLAQHNPIKYSKSLLFVGYDLPLIAKVYTTSATCGSMG